MIAKNLNILIVTVDPASGVVNLQEGRYFQCGTEQPKLRFFCR